MDILALLALVIALAFAIGATIRRPFVVVLMAAIWPLYAGGLVAGFWGNGVGDGLLGSTMVLTIFTTAGALGGVISGRAWISGRAGP